MLSSRALQLLRAGAGHPGAQFRTGQLEAITHLVENRGRLLVIQKTGWGKSFVYFITAKILREQGLGPTLLISPLLALMRNQLEAARRMGLEAFTINSANQKDWDQVEQKVSQNQVDILLISPERLANERFQEQVLTKVSASVPLVVIDEAHCLSDWGHDFRPHYRLIERVLRAMPSGPRLLATTATANRRVQADLEEILGNNLTTQRGDLSRPSLVLQTILLPHQTQRMAWLAENIPRLPGSGIVYTLTTRDACQVARWLQSLGLAVEPYISDSPNRPELEDALLNNQVKALIATTALGMGYDKPDLGFVVHYQTPGSAVAYYQQVGRAGRALTLAYGILLSGSEEHAINDFFIESAFPVESDVIEILKLLEAEPLSLEQLQERLNLRQSVIQKALDLLALESPAPVVKQDGSWHRSHTVLQPTFWERARRLTAQRKEEQRQMQDYVRLSQGHMSFLVQALDSPALPTTPPMASPFAQVVDPELVKKASLFLRQADLEIAPRRMWPATVTISLKRQIAPEHQACVGRALSTWRDAGWGEVVYKGKYVDGRFSDDLLEACVQMLERWNPQPPPSWVSCIPSQKRPNLVPDFASRLAGRLGLPFHCVLAKTEDRPEQKTMSNSHQQVANVLGSLAITHSPPPGPVLLVDDLVDSRWTLTLASWLIRSNGGGPVFPLALAAAGGDS